jgi:hypothetical protein
MMKNLRLYKAIRPSSKLLRIESLRQVVPKLFQWADHLKYISAPRRTNY